MDTTQLAQMVTWLDEQHRRDRTEITRLQQRIEAQTNEIQEQARHIQELEARISSIQSQLGRFEQIEQALTNLKNEVTLLINAQAEEITKIQRDTERARMTDRESFGRAITEMRKELPRFRAIEEELAVRKAEDQRLGEVVINLRQEIADINKEIDERTRGLPYLIEQRNHDNRRIAQLQQENVEMFKRVEEIGSKTQMLEHKQQKTEAQVRGLPGLVEDMRRGQEQFIESLKLADADRQRQMREWQATFDDYETILKSQTAHIQEFAAANEEARRIINGIGQFQERLQREQNQVAQLQRLAEERQRKELETFLADNEKRWKKQLLEWQYQWEQQEKINVQVRDRFPKITVQLAHHEEMLNFLWRITEVQSGSQLKSAQEWLTEVQKLADQREALLRKYEEEKLQQ